MKSNKNCKCTSCFCETTALTCPILVHLPYLQEIVSISIRIIPTSHSHFRGNSIAYFRLRPKLHVFRANASQQSLPTCSAHGWLSPRAHEKRTRWLPVVVPLPPLTSSLLTSNAAKCLKSYPTLHCALYHPAWSGLLATATLSKVKQMQLRTGKGRVCNPFFFVWSAPARCWRRTVGPSFLLPPCLPNPGFRATGSGRTAEKNALFAEW